jgi:peroxiredoxin
VSSRAHLLVHFVAAASAAPSAAASAAGLHAVADALTRGDLSDRSLFVVGVLPPGMSGKTELTEMAGKTEMTGRTGKVALPAGGKQAGYALTEDHEGGWAKLFSPPPQTPATYLVAPHGQLLWQHAGPLDATLLAEVLQDKVPASAGPIFSQQMPLAVRIGQAAPDVALAFAPGHQMMLRRLRGRPVLLCFWKSWSLPCQGELQALQALHEHVGKAGTAGTAGALVLAVNDGEDPAQAQEAFARWGLSVAFVPDPQRAIARAYGIACWPTTVAIDARGLVSSVQMGRSRDRSFFHQPQPIPGTKAE